MFRYPADRVLTSSNLLDFIGLHKNEITQRYQKLHNAYVSDHEILHQKDKPKWKPDQRIVVNFPKYITDTMNGFFIGNPVKSIAKDKKVAEYVEFLEKYSNQDDNNAELSKICSIYGKGYEMYYLDEYKELCITYLSPMQSFMIYDESIVERPLYFVRVYKDYDGNECGSISDNATVRHFRTNGGFQWLDEAEPHYFDGVPAVEYMENEERQGIFEPILSISNAYNKAISEKANDVDYFADAYMKLLGPKVDEEDVQFIRDTRILNFEGDDASKIIAEFMDKPTNDTAQENLLNRLERLAFQISMVANISDESFGSSSGIALKYKLQAMSNLEKTKRRKFEAGMQRRYKLLFSHPLSRVPADAWMQIKFVFTPNYPANLLEEVQIASGMEGITSHKTQLSVISSVENVDDELEQIEKENEPEENDILARVMFGRQKEEAAEEPETEREEESAEGEL